jgi:NAD(P)-dependent dehydrogenase (short-subunit alcohol dehydrogenase family)
MRLQDKIAIVTGAGRGIGQGIAVKLANEGAKVTVVDVSADNGENTVSLIRKNGGEAIFVPCNIAKQEEVEALFDKVVTEFGTVDILVNNAGINRDGMLHKLTHEQWDQVMREKQYGRIINIASASWLGNVGQANYAASKAGVVGLTKTAARELAKYNVTVNAICPGFIDTDMTRGVPDKVWDMMISKIPMGRAGKPEDVANLIAFLASDEAEYITAEVMNVGGGMVL